MKQFERDGLRFDVGDAGPSDGPVVILLHGFPQTGAAWDEITPTLNAAGYRTLSPDQRGYSPGARPPSRRAYRMPELVADVLALGDAAKAERFHVVGHDWGGAVAWAVAAWHPDRVATLTSLGTPHPRAFRRAVMTSRQGLHSWYMAAFQVPVLPERLSLLDGGRRCRDGLTRTGLPAEKAERYVNHLGTPEAMRGAINWYRGIQPLAVSKVGPVSVPTLYIWSTRDQFILRRGAEATADHVTGPYRFEVLEGISHWIPEQAPERVAALLVEHLEGRH